MIKRIKLWFVFLIILQSSTAFCYKPLLQSERYRDWERKHPQKLPFSKCYLTSQPVFERGLRYLWSSHPSADPFVGGSLFGFHGDTTTGNAFISCVCDALDIAFSIPINESIAVTFPALGMTALFEGLSKIRNKSLDGKSVAHLFGSYIGFKASLGYPVGGGIGIYKNAHGISLLSSEAGILLLAEAGVSLINLSPRNTMNLLRLNRKYGKNPFVITGNKLSPDQKTDITNFLDRDEKGTFVLNTKSGEAIDLGTQEEGCKLSFHQLNLQGGLDKARLLKVYRDCSIAVEFDDTSIVIQSINLQNKISNVVVRDPNADQVFEGMKFVRIKYKKPKKYNLKDFPLATLQKSIQR